MTMTLRQRLLTVLRGGPADRIPWNIYAWLLPQSAAAQALPGKGLSLMGTCPISRPVFSDVTIVEHRETIDGRPYIHKRIETPVGTLTQVTTFDPTLNSAWIQKHFIAGPEDYRPAEFYFRHTSFKPDFDGWRHADSEMGQQGIVVGEIMPIPLLYLMVSWMGAEGLAEGIYLYTERFESLLDALNAHYDRQIQLAADSPAEVIWFPDNITGSIISPRLYARYCAPIYARAMPIMRTARKIPIAHYDGSNRPLLRVVADTDLPVIEAFTPPPMGDLPVAEAKAAWPDKVIWVNFPGCHFTRSAEFIRSYTLELLREAAPGGRLVLGCTEEFPVDEFVKTFTAIGRALAEYEGYAW